VTTLTGADIMAGADVTITGGDGASNQNYPSAIGLGTGAVGLYDYTGTTYTWGALRYEAPTASSTLPLALRGSAPRPHAPR